MSRVETYSWLQGSRWAAHTVQIHPRSLGFVTPKLVHLSQRALPCCPMPWCLQNQRFKKKHIPCFPAPSQKTNAEILVLSSFKCKGMCPQAASTSTKQLSHFEAWGSWEPCFGTLFLQALCSRPCLIIPVRCISTGDPDSESLFVSDCYAHI